MNNPTKSEGNSQTIKVTTQNSFSDLHHYVPRRNLPRMSVSQPHSHNSPIQQRYHIIDRISCNDSVPRYILKTLSASNGFASFIRVTVFDIEDYVSQKELESFENRRYNSGEDDFSSPREWALLIKRAKRKGTDLFRRHPNTEVVINRTRPAQEDRRMAKRQKLLFSGIVQPPDNLKSTSYLDVANYEDGSIAEVDDSEYEISGVISHRDVMGFRWYLVTWHGYADIEATWLSEEDLDGAKEVVNDYWKKLDHGSTQDAIDEMPLDMVHIDAELNGHSATNGESINESANLPFDDHLSHRIDEPVNCVIHEIKPKSNANKLPPKFCATRL